MPFSLAAFLPVRGDASAGISRHRVSVCLSVCLHVCVAVCVTRRYCIKTIKQTTPHDSPGL